jgi:3-isopropylmalate/(R)-2-methylmalate dehydratase small subunit
MGKIIIRGNAWILGDNIDGDSGILSWDVTRVAHTLTDEEELEKLLRANVLKVVDPDFPVKFKGGIIVAGKNFIRGLGHSVQIEALAVAGVKAVLAESFGQYFSCIYRYGIDLGVPLLPCPGITGIASQGDELELDVKTGAVKNITTGKTTKTTKVIPSGILEFYEKGQINYIKEKMSTMS